MPRRDEGAIRSMVLGIVGLVFCPLVFATGALVEGFKSRKRIRESNGWLHGDGFALAGVILGVVGWCLVPFWLMLAFSGS